MLHVIECGLPVALMLHNTRLTHSNRTPQFVSLELGSACGLLQYQVVPSQKFSSTSALHDLYGFHLQTDTECNAHSITLSPKLE